LSDVARLESGHTPSRSKVEYWDGEIPWIGIRDATGNHGRTINSTAQTITQAGLDNSSARRLPAGTVCLSRTASVGYVVQMGVPMATSQDFVNWACGPDLSPGYLKYVLLGEQDSIRRFAHGTTHQTMYYPEAKALHALLPARPVQDAVVAVLGALDEKITANAQLVSRTDDLVAALFKRASADSPMGTLSEIAEVNASSVKARPHGSLTYLDIASVGVGSYDVPAPIDWADAPGRARRRLRCGDTVWSTVRPNRRSHALVLDDGDDLIASTGLAVITPHASRFAYVYEATRTQQFASFLVGAAEGSAYPAVRGQRFLGAPVPLLTPTEADRFEEVAAPLRLRAHAAAVESRGLAATRDALLPQLMSGKLKVNDAERAVEEVV
jgi:type I restriction enzyme S subunit